MTFLSHLGKGLCYGAAGGAISAAYLYGSAEKYQNKDSVFGEVYGGALVGLSAASLIYGPIIGAGAGVSIYGTKKVVNFVQTKVPHPVQKKAFIVVCVIAATGLLASGAYESGKKDNRS